MDHLSCLWDQFVLIRSSIHVLPDIDNERTAATSTACTCRFNFRVKIPIEISLLTIFFIFSSTSSLETKPLPRLPDDELNKKKKTNSKGKFHHFS
jgi:hypothetical protein